MAKIKCSCGTVYDSNFKFCPECAKQNPYYQAQPQQTVPPKKSTLHNTQSQTQMQNQTQPNPVPKQKKSTVIYSNSQFWNNNTQQTSNNNMQQAPNNMQQQVDNDFADYEDEPTNEPEYIEDVNENDFADYEDEYEDVDTDEEVIEYIEDESNDEAPNNISTSRIISSRNQKAPNALKAPTIKGNVRSSASTTSTPQYDPNHDGYYDDRLPAILDEVTKTSHMDVIAKIVLAVVCLTALITYCIFYVKV